jgi:hypothetical protein
MIESRKNRNGFIFYIYKIFNILVYFIYIPLHVSICEVHYQVLYQ